MTTTIQAGKLGEDAAVKLLEREGYKILDRNFRSRVGEIDIISQDGNTLVFVEVKTRWSKKFGYPEEAVTPRKLWAIGRTGEYYKLTHPNTPDLLRIDVVAIEVEQGRIVAGKIIKNAGG
ncbi:MAG: YraN family protein [bacterium]|nr:YraN family protein [bacterium]